MPTPTRETLAMFESINRSSKFRESFSLFITVVVEISSSLDTVNVKSVFPLTLTF